MRKLARSLFGSSRSSTRPKPQKAKTVRKTGKVRKVKKAAKRKKPATKKAVARKARPAGKPRKSAKKKKRQPVLVKEALSLIPVGEVTHFFPHVQAAVVKITQGEVRQGETLSFRGHTTKLKQTVDSMQIDHVPIPLAKKGDEIGIRVNSRVRAGDKVYKV